MNAVWSFQMENFHFRIESKPIATTLPPPPSAAALKMHFLLRLFFRTQVIQFQITSNPIVLCMLNLFQKLYCQNVIMPACIFMGDVNLFSFFLQDSNWFVFLLFSANFASFSKCLQHILMLFYVFFPCVIYKFYYFSTECKWCWYDCWWWCCQCWHMLERNGTLLYLLCAMATGQHTNSHHVAGCADDEYMCAYTAQTFRRLSKTIWCNFQFTRVSTLTQKSKNRRT